MYILVESCQFIIRLLLSGGLEFGGGAWNSCGGKVSGGHMTIVPGYCVCRPLLVLQLRGGAVSCSRGLSSCGLLFPRPCYRVLPFDSLSFVSLGDRTAALEKKLHLEVRRAAAPVLPPPQKRLPARPRPPAPDPDLASAQAELGTAICDSGGRCLSSPVPGGVAQRVGRVVQRVERIRSTG